MRCFKAKGSKIALLFSIALVMVIATGCSENVPDTTSAEAGLYLLEDTVVGLDGKSIEKDGKQVYGLAHNGDIISLADGKIIVSAYNVEEFTCVEKAEVVNKDDLKVNVSAPAIPQSENECEPKTFSIKLSVTPDDVVSKYIFIKASNKAVVCFVENEDTIYVEADDKGVATIELTARNVGSGRFTVTNALGKVICTFTVSVEEGDETDTPDESEASAPSVIVPASNVQKPVPTPKPTKKPDPTSTPTKKPTPTATPSEKPDPTSTPTEKPNPTSTPTEKPDSTSTPKPTKKPKTTPSPSPESTPTTDIEPEETET